MSPLVSIRLALLALSPEAYDPIIAAALAEPDFDAAELGGELAELLDEAVDLAALLPAPFGAIAEAVDGALYERLVTRALERIDTPEERQALSDGFWAKAKARRSMRVASRRAKRKAHKVSDYTPGS